MRSDLWPTSFPAVAFMTSVSVLGLQLAGCHQASVWTVPQDFAVLSTALEPSLREKKFVAL